MAKTKMKKGLKITLIILGVLLVLIVAALLIAPKMIVKTIYKQNFGTRFTSSEPHCRDIAEFDGLEREKHVFTSNEGQKITGYVYKKGDTEPKGLIVLAHGFGGGGHCSYMDVADYFASNGYNVFAYDATGNDESEGESVKGLPQGVIDLDYALNYIKADEELSDLPLMLWGHSWGGYSACSVSKLHPEIEGIISVAGFNSSLDMIENVGRDMAGDAIDYAMPIFEDLEKDKFGDFATMNVLESLERATADVLIYHSADDDVIPIELSYDKYYEKFADNERFTFVRFEDRGHNYIFNSAESLEYREKVNADYKKYVESIGEENVTPEIRLDFIKKNVDRMKFFELDSETMEQMLEFYDNCIE
ncbi:MAG: alpha/beta fold hydrolase [Ruminococcus sp.]|nr:alpha/beta fold hydrolase [Ruminococcus sp.]